MLLRRITKHVKAQNWFAVGLDFFIVVAGILLAFWINALADGRAEQRSLHVALERLHDEIQSNVAAIDEYSRRHADIVSAGQALLKLARDPNLETVPMDLVGKVFVDGYTTDYSTSALTSVLNRQSFKGMQSNELRPVISALPAEYLDAMEDELIVIQLLDTYWNPFITQKLPVGPLWVSAYKSTEWESYFASTEETPDYGAVSAPEFAELASSMIFQNHIVNRISYERLILIEQKELRIVLQEALALIKEEI